MNPEPKLRAIPVVGQVSPMVFNLIDLTPEVNALVFGWRADSYEFDALTFLSGRKFENGKPEVLLGEVLASGMHKGVGDQIEIQGSTFTVVGIFHGGTALEAGAVIMPIDQLQQLSSLQGKVSGYHVRLKPAPAGEAESAYLKRSQKEIEAALPGLTPNSPPSAPATISSSGWPTPSPGEPPPSLSDGHPRHRQHHGHVGL